VTRAITPAQRRWYAAEAFIRASDNARLLEQVARARKESVDHWLHDADLQAVKNAAAELDLLGIRSSGRPRPGEQRRPSWH
jgi:hypothetical protein